ncbi:MAG: type II toxin-antitoxin system RelE/ParE family toxin [Bacillota bacterium]|nr:type II toxin-antitoxin system RelE/ParE family toxin [Bacillota bacterium]
MYREFIRMPEFEKRWESIGLTEDDIVDLEYALIINPNSGDIVEGTGGLRKFRWALPNRGKRGSIRVVYVDFVSFEKLYFISAYTKDEKDNLTNTERSEIKRVIKKLRDDCRGR